MHAARAALLIAVLFVANPRAATADVITWQFDGGLNFVNNILGLAPLYPIGTAISLEVTFDTAAPQFVPFCGSAEGLYRPFVASTFTLAGETYRDTLPGGYAAINHHFDRGCMGFSGIPSMPFAEFWIFGPWSGPPLNPESPQLTRLGLVTLLFNDPTLTNGQLPSNQPPGAGVFLSDGRDIFFASGFVTPVETLPVIPEPGSIILLTTGLVGLGLRRIRRRTMGSITEALQISAFQAKH